MTHTERSPFSRRAAAAGGGPPVITPGGPRPKGSVRGVGPGETVVRTAEGTLTVVPTAELVQGKGGGMSDDLVLTPGGPRSRSVVHLIEDGAVLDGTDGRLRKLGGAGELLTDFGVLQRRTGGVPLQPGNVAHPLPGATPSFGSGWITYASWTNATGAPVSSFATTWVVPDPPSTQSGQVIFLFPGIQNSTMIYQPVLQWGVSAAGGGDYWAVASWYVDGQGGIAFHSNLVQVNPGDTLVGVMTLTGQSGSLFSYNCSFQGIANASLPISNVEQLTWLIETLECYGITKGSDYPDAALTEMKNIAIAAGAAHPAMTWGVNNAVTDCGQHTVIVSNSPAAGIVELNYYGDQVNWAWCRKCQGMAFAGNILPGACPAGASHDHSGSGNYVIAFNTSPGPSGQSDWRWCRKCQGLSFAGNAAPGPCPAGGQHDHSGSGDYVVAFESSAQPEQGNWRWCNKCQGLAFAGNPAPGPCPAGGSHNHAGSGDYVPAYDVSAAGGQANWRWCNKCQVLAFAGNPAPGPCPAGGSHNHAGSANYVLAFSGSAPAAGAQANWRWCRKCQGLTFGGNPAPGPCPAGGQHDHSGSGDYLLAEV